MTLAARGAGWTAGGRLVVDGVSLAPRPGETVGLLGPNGSGKSSFLRLLAGLRRPSSGAVTLDDRDLAAVGRREVARRVAMVEQDVATDQDPSVRDVIELGRTPFRRPWAPHTAEDDVAVLRAATMTEVEDRLDQRYRTLSGGERQRVQVARALAQEPTDLLLDEPTNHLDVRHQLEILALVRSLPATTVVALHDLNLATRFCDHVVVLRAGRAVAAGPPAEAVTTALVGEVYGVRARVTHDDLGTHVRFIGP